MKSPFTHDRHHPKRENVAQHSGFHPQPKVRATLKGTISKQNHTKIPWLSFQWTLAVYPHPESKNEFIPLDKEHHVKILPQYTQGFLFLRREVREGPGNEVVTSFEGFSFESRGRG